MMPVERLEELSMNAWPALQTVFYDGWVLRFANGYTRRANSVTPLYDSGLDVASKIDACERIYDRRGLRVVFKMTAQVHPPDLDVLLAGRGYLVEAPTSVQLLDLAGLGLTASGLSHMGQCLTTDWLADYRRLSGIDDRHLPALRAMLESQLLQRALASLRRDGRVIACGTAVVEEGYAGLFDIVTDKAWRNQGHGRRLVLDLLAWARDQGAHTAYLQVMLDNPAALHLYSQLGFREAYRYWYRVAPFRDPSAPGAVERAGTASAAPRPATSLHRPSSAR